MLEKSTYKTRQAHNNAIPVLRQEFIDDCIKKQQLLATTSYNAGGALEGKKFQHGNISGISAFPSPHLIAQIGIP